MKLYEHQKQALEATRGLSRVAYYLDMGLGKTYVGSEKMRELDYRVNLIVCQKSKIKDWIDHFESNYECPMIFDLTKPKQFKKFTLNAFYGEAPMIGIINYELAWRRYELLSLNCFCLLLDESSLIQNAKAKQTKFIMRLTPSAVILLSGTPTAGKYENLWTQAHLLGWNITERTYKSHFINWKKINVGAGLSFITIDRENPYKNVDRLKSKLREHGAVFMKTDEVLDMPEQNFIVQNVPTSAEYKHFMKTGYVQVFDELEIVGDTRLTQRLRARKLCGQYSREKIKAFEELLESTNDRLIVFYNFTDELYELLKITENKRRRVSVINAKTKDLYNYEKYEDAVTFVQYQAGAMGLNLQKANKVIYFTLPERSELFEQSKKRIHRIGQSKPCFYYILQCENSIEEDIYQTLLERRDYTDELFKTVQGSH